MEGEMYNFMKVWFLVIVSLTYCFAIGKITPKGITRLLCVLPIVCLFLVLPLKLSSIHFCGITSFFIAWLANFKLLLFAFDEGPLCLDPTISLGHFLAIACLPIKIQQISQSNGHDKQNPISNKGPKSFLNYAIKGVLVAMFVRLYNYSDYINPNILWLMYCFHIYFFLEIILAMIASLARALLGLELEPQFNDPYLSTSLQDFWGRRWNIMVTSILRPTVYYPILDICKNTIGRRWAQFLAVLGTFMLSALMHELIFLYLGRVKPTGEIALFFLLHGVCLGVEIALKKAVNGKWRFPRYAESFFTVSFVLVTGFWLFLPPILRSRSDVRAINEYAAVGACLKNIGRVFVLRFFNTSNNVL